MNITKEDLIRAISKETDLNKGQVTEALESFFKLVPNILSGGDTIQLRGFGTFSSFTKKEKRYKPKGGKEIISPSQVVMKFKFSKKHKLD